MRAFLLQISIISMIFAVACGNDNSNPSGDENKPEETDSENNPEETDSDTTDDKDTSFNPITFQLPMICSGQSNDGSATVWYADLDENQASSPDFFTELDGKIYFTSWYDGVAFAALWVFDPNTGLVGMAIDPEEEITHMRNLVAHNGKLYFSGEILMEDDDSTTYSDSELYVYDPTTAIAERIELNEDGSAQPTNFLSGTDGKLYFQAGTTNWYEGPTGVLARGQYDRELGRYDPDTGDYTVFQVYEGTLSPNLACCNAPKSGTPQNMLEHNGYIYMSARQDEGLELYRFDMANPGFERLSNIAPGVTFERGKSSNPQDLTIIDGKLYFNAADDGAENRELWIFDPNEAPGPGNPREVVIDPGMKLTEGSWVPAGSNPSYFTEYDGLIYMRAQRVLDGTELFAYDPALPNEVELVFDSHEGTSLFVDQGGNSMEQGNDGYTNELLRRGDKLYYVGHFDNRELWVFDPTTNQGEQFIEIYPGNIDEPGSEHLLGHGSPLHMTLAHDNLYFRASNDKVDLEFHMVTWDVTECP